MRIPSLDPLDKATFKFSAQGLRLAQSLQNGGKIRLQIDVEIKGRAVEHFGVLAQDSHGDECVPGQGFANSDCQNLVAKVFQRIHELADVVVGRKQGGLCLG